MRNTPSLWNMILEQFRKLFRCLFRNRISPCPERDQKLSIFVKCHITMHHSTKSNCSKLCNLYPVLILYILHHTTITVLYASPDIFQSIGPYSIVISIFPVMTSRCHRFIFFINQDSLDPCGSKFNPKNRFSFFDHLFCILNINCHFLFLLLKPHF